MEDENHGIILMHVHYPIDLWLVVEVMAMVLVGFVLNIFIGWWAWILLPPYLVGKFVGWTMAKRRAESVYFTSPEELEIEIV